MRDPHSGVTLRRNAWPQTWSAKADALSFAPLWQTSSDRTRHKLASCPEIDCVRHLMPPGVIAAAELRAIEIGTGADRVLVAEGAISDEQYVRALAFSLGTSYDDLRHVPRAACPAADLEMIEAARTGILWLATGQRRLLVIAPHSLAGRHLVTQLKFAPHLSKDIYLTTSGHLLDFINRHAASTLTRKAAFELRTTQPDFSAGKGRAQPILAAIGWAAVLATFITAPAPTMTVLAVILLSWAILRVIGALTTGLLWTRDTAIPDYELPAYSIIVALYREATAVQGLVEALEALDYPLEKLDITFVLEADDAETRYALSKLNLGPPFTIVTAPGIGPKTKPKALNAALPFARGTYVAIFDAEDRPEPDQLRKAVQAFRSGHQKLACVQARLTIDNSTDSWLTRMFAAEYAGLFDVFLPGLAAWHLPLPLGGSSNHFRTSTLREAGAWDPYNVTEDADLGMRLARLGYHAAVISSTTYEEAPARFVPWLKQRSRWFKGWMQTWLVHMRHPIRLWRDLKPSGFMVFQLVIGGTVLAAIAHGLFAAMLGWQIASGWLWSEKSSVGDIVIAGLHATTFISGYLISGFLGVSGLARRGMMHNAWALLLMPLYWLLLSIAAWRALFQLIFTPYTWEKTEHTHARLPSRPPRITS